MTHFENHWHVMLINIKNIYSDTGKCIHYIPCNSDDWNTEGFSNHNNKNTKR